MEKTGALLVWKPFSRRSQHADAHAEGLGLFEYGRYH